MYDLRWIRDHPGEFKRGLARRGLEADAEKVLDLDRNWRDAETRAQRAQAERNRVSRSIGAARGAAAGVNVEFDQFGAKSAAAAARNATDKAAQLRAENDEILAGLPNLPADDVPDGPDDTANVVLRHHGEPPRFDFGPLSHEAIGERLGLMDFARAGKLSGSRFVVLRGALARLERALGQFMLDLHTTEFGYTEISPPLLVRDEAVFGVAQLPKFAKTCFARQTAIG